MVEGGVLLVLHCHQYKGGNTDGHEEPQEHHPPPQPNPAAYTTATRLPHTIPKMMATLRGTMNQQNRQTLGLETTVLLDSGSNDTIMSQELYEALPAQTRPTLQPSSAQFFTATTGDDPHANILGTATFHLRTQTIPSSPMTQPR